MVLFHGSDKIIINPSKEGGRPNNDYGQGFYCTEHLDLAREWACSEASTAFVSHYSLVPELELKVCDLQGPGYHVLNWLAVLLKHRVFDITFEFLAAIKEYILEEFLPDLSGFDIIKGYRADDSYFGIARAFLQGSIPLEKLAEALRLGKLGEQTFIQSEKAFEALTFVSAEPVDKSIYLPKRLKRDTDARDAFKQMRQDLVGASGTFAIDLYRNNWKNDDARLS